VVHVLHFFQAAMKPLKRILFATDFSKASRRAFEAAEALARSNGARLLVLHVHVPLVPLLPEQYIESPKWAALDVTEKRAHERQLNALVRRAEKRGIGASPLLVDGEPSRQIVRFARRKHADLVVIGTHGRTGFGRFFLGSVASRVVATASCPVLTVRGA
jgi:nucleotide-binding universal stress UspA family protein